MAHLIDIFLQPGRVFADLNVKPSFAVPLLVLALCSAALLLLYSLQVDPEWYIDHALAAGGAEMSAAELEQARKVMPGARTMGYFGSVIALVSTVVVTTLYALYFMLVGRITGISTSFRHAMALGSWAQMPLLLGAVVALIGVYSMAPQTGLEALMFTNVDPLLVQLPSDSPWRTLAQSFSLLTFWVVFLLALGWRVWGRTGWTQAIVVAALPVIIIYGAMALYAMLG